MDKSKSVMVSICIPTYEMGGWGVNFLEHSFGAINIQSYRNFEVIVSDHSENDDILKLCNRWGSLFKIRYFKNKEKRGSSSANLNNAIRHAKGQWIKPLFQDDFFYNYLGLQSLVDSIGESNWVASTCVHSDGENFFNPHLPYYHDEIQYGRNTISSPSVIMFKRNKNLLFDENLLWLMDVDFYKTLHTHYGMPSICRTCTVVNRTGDHQVSNNQATEELREREQRYVREKYKV